MNSTKCEPVESFKTKFTKLAKSQFTETEFMKILSLIGLASNDSSSIELIEQNQKRELDKTNEPLVDVCKLPKLIGDCNNSTDRYFYDYVSERCLVFPYSGCNGNQNNFETLDACSLKCSPKKAIDNQNNESHLIVNTTTPILQTIKSSTRTTLVDDLNN